jgi:glycosyltransferase involved in cell wall biosynthesis
MSHVIYFPNDEFVKRVTSMFAHEGDWLAPLPDWLTKMGGAPDEIAQRAGEYIIGYDEFMGMEWDAVFLSRYESQDIFKNLLALHPNGKKIKVIGMTGNDNTTYDWEFVKNFMSTDELSYHMAPKDINKIWYDQEIGQHYGRVYTPIDNQSLRTVNTFVNCWPSFDQEWTWDCEYTGAHGKCPHCASDHRGVTNAEKIRPYWIWSNAASVLRDMGYKCCEYGINCKDGMIQESKLPNVYASGALTVHMKTYEGYGYSLLQSIACGRPVIIPRGFYKYRTANKFLIPNLTCFEMDTWSDSALTEVVRGVTRDLETMQRYSWACYQAAKGMFNWDLEAYRMKEFFRRLQ